jgi:hypothetical protein
MHICNQCERRFAESKPNMIVCSGKEICFFCSASCRDEWMFPKLLLEWVRTTVPNSELDRALQPLKS